MTSRFLHQLRLAGSLSLAALLGAGALSATPAGARSGPPADPELSPRLAELSRPAVRSLPPAAQARRLDVAVRGPGSLLRRGNRVLVDVRFSSGAIAALDELRRSGARFLTPSRRYQTVTVAVAPHRLRELADLPGVEGISEKRTPLISSTSAAAVGADCEGGAVISEGVAQLHAAAARSKYGVDGSGVTVGVLSDSYDQSSFAADGSGPVATHAAEDVESNDLPGAANSCAGEKAEVDVLQDFGPFPGFEPSDEGRAMLQIVHDLAPGASLAFATAFASELSFAQNIEELAEPVSEGGAGAQVIVDDVIWFEEPFFQDGPIAVAVDKVAADGVAYFSSAGNNNLFEGPNEIASWEAPEFRDAGTCPAPLLPLIPAGTDHCMDFDPGGGTDTTFALAVSPGATLNLDLQWAEPWFGVETDLDAYLFDLSGNLLAVEESDNVGATQRPVELPTWQNTGASTKTVRLVINRCAGSCNPAAGTDTPALKFALLQNGGGVTNTEYPTSSGGDVVGPTIFGHAAASGAVAVGAVPYFDDDQVESFSSRGPVVHRFEPVAGTTPADPLPTPETIDKPDLSATDCGATTFFSFLAGDGEWRFCGTSAAAPHAAAVAALQLEADPGATVEELRTAQTSTATPVGAFGPKAVGAGLLEADAAIAALLPSATITIDEHPGSRTADPTPTFGWEATAGTEFTCSIDEVAPEPCNSGSYTPPSPLPDGPHVFEVEGVDVTGSASFSFTVDTTPPAIGFGQRPPAISAIAKPTFGFTTSEPASIVCSLDGAASQPCKSPHTVAQALPDGAHSFAVTATDQVGNSATATVPFTVDTTAPTVVLTQRPAERSTDRTPGFAFVASEPAVFTCGIDGASQSCSSPFEAPPLGDGSHAFEVVAVDLAGNAGRDGAQFVVDTGPPETGFRSRLRALVRTRKGSARLTVRFSADEPGASFLCRVDRGSLRPCGPLLSRRFRPGRHAIRVQARDELGNLDPTPAVYRFRVERTE